MEAKILNVMKESNPLLTLADKISSQVTTVTYVPWE